MISRVVARLLPFVPKPIVWRVSRRYIAGETLEHALDTVHSLNQQGMRATLDVLGEDTTRREQAKEGAQLYHAALAAIAERGLDCNISVKLSQMALRYDADYCDTIMTALVRDAKERGNFVRIDMEDSSVTTQTLDVYRRFRREFPGSVGTVVQAYLKRTEADVRALLEEAPTHLRLCKGIYQEPPDIAFQDKERVRESFRSLLSILFDGGIERVGIATHDEALVDNALEQIRERNVPRERYEFQMLLGVTERLRDRIVADGHPLRVYVPFGQDWFPYSIRRLRENPEIVSHVIKGFFIRK